MSLTCTGLDVHCYRRSKVVTPTLTCVFMPSGFVIEDEGSSSPAPEPVEPDDRDL